jgi:hypothetical protein
MEQHMHARARLEGVMSGALWQVRAARRKVSLRGVFAQSHDAPHRAIDTGTSKRFD